jgi:hypothetical protein
MTTAGIGQNHTIEFNESLRQVADRLVESTAQLITKAKNEEDLRIGFEKILEPLCAGINIKLHPEYEKTIFKSGRADAVHGQVIIEYKKPLAFRQKKYINDVFKQLIEYIDGEAKSREDALFLLDPKLVGIGFDGEQILFVQYQGDKAIPKTELSKSDFKLIGPYKFNSQSARTLLTYLRALSRRLLTAENLVEIFGPKSKLAPLMVSAFIEAIENWDIKSRANTYYYEWLRLFGIIYGEHLDIQQAEETKELSKLYGVDVNLDFQKLLFSVHTYYVFLMKLIAAELVSISETSFKSSFSDDLAHSNDANLRTKLSEIEEGGVFTNRGITNFLEGDFFSWYLYAFSPRLIDAIREVARAFTEFEPATTSLYPKQTHDLLKKLYEFLVPRVVRHKLGEYYTPDWLAELVLNEVGYKGNTLKRLLDPACGSGTFVVLAIQRAKEFGKKNKEKDLETAKRIVANIWGFDLNPLAVIAARTNYLFSLGELAGELKNLEIPIYLADSVLWPEKKGQFQLNYAGGEHVVIQTSVGQFHVPNIWVKTEGFLMRKAAPLIENMIKQDYTVEEAVEGLKKEGLVFPPHERVVQNFYNEIMELEKEGKNGIWARFLKNIFAPMVAKKFDYVVGNPPWIRWGYLSQEYREATLRMWKDYGIFSLKGHAARLGGGEKDFSMLFTYASADYYLKKNAKLGFLITQEVFKSKGAGEGFRRFRLSDKVPLKVTQAHDLVTVMPFKGSANKTAAIFLTKGQKTSYPVDYTIWSRLKGVGKIDASIPLIEALPLLNKQKLQARPVDSQNGSWQTFRKDQEQLFEIKGDNYYLARRGASTEPYGVFWLQLIQVLSDGNLLVKNMPEKGKLNIKNVTERIEVDLVFPGVRGRDIARWGIISNIYVLITQDKNTRKGFAESEMRSRWPRTFGYLTIFKNNLLNRASYKKYHRDVGNSFFSQYNIADYTFANYKVVWKRMSNDLFAAVITQFKTPFGFKTIIPTDTTSSIATDNEEEAHYICAIINSTPVREFIKSFSSAGRGFGAPSIMKYICIPKFDPKNNLHNRLSELSLTLHKLKSEDAVDEIADLERNLDIVVMELFDIKHRKTTLP